MAKGVPAAEVQKNFGLYQDQALVAPVAVTKYGRPTVVILAASEYERLKRLDRQALAVTELTEQDIAAIESAKIPRERRYRSDRLR